MLGRRLYRIKAKLFADTFDRDECEVSFPMFYAAHIGSVHFYKISEVLLAHTFRLAIRTQIPSKCAL